VTAWLTLLRREWWEHRAAFGWTPLAIAALTVLFTSWVVGVGDAGGLHIEYRGNGIDSLGGLLDFSAWPPELVAARLDVLLHVVSRPFVYAHYLIATLVLAGALNDDRRDRSVLFWQSLPVSDLATVTSKLALVVCVAPLVTVAALAATWCAVLLLLGQFADAPDASAGPFAMAGIPGRTLAYVTGYAIQSLWTLPLIVMVLVVSAAVPRAPIVWATVAPLVPVVLERMFLGSNRLWTWLVEHASLVALPRPAAASARGQGTIGLAEQFSLLTSIDLWIGVAVGIALLAFAIRLRSRATDL
jgi:ABC-2 type transport system permease protein